jgi:hypothetical protein
LADAGESPLAAEAVRRIDRGDAGEFTSQIATLLGHSAFAVGTALF